MHVGENPLLEEPGVVVDQSRVGCCRRADGPVYRGRDLLGVVDEFDAGDGYARFGAFEDARVAAHDVFDVDLGLLVCDCSDG